MRHNGNLVNSYELRQELELGGAIFHTTSDTEVISYIITQERIKTASIEQAVEGALGRIKGAYSLVLMSPSKLIAVRDPNGFRPLCYGKTDDGAFIVASESAALDAVGASFVLGCTVREKSLCLMPRVCAVFQHTAAQCSPRCACLNIFISPGLDSVIDGCSVHSARVRAGAFLALEHPVQADIRDRRAGFRH